MVNSSEKKDVGNIQGFDLNSATLPMNLQMFAMRLNMIGMRLLTVRADRTSITVNTVQTMENDPQAARKSFGEMFSTKTIGSRDIEK